MGAALYYIQVRSATKVETATTCIFSNLISRSSKNMSNDQQPQALLTPRNNCDYCMVPRRGRK